MMTIIFVMNDNSKLEMQCENFTLEKNRLGEMVGWKATGITKNKPIYLPIEIIKYIYRKLDDEMGCCDE